MERTIDSMNKRVLVIAAHPDDELLGCGASVALHTSRGDHVRSIILCEGETMRGQDGSGKRSATEEAARILGVESVVLVGLPDQHLDTLPIVDVITPIEIAVREFEPNIIYVHSGSDINRDHQVVFEAALVALRPKNEYIEEIYSFYTVGATEWGYPRSFNPDTWIGFDEKIMKQKLDAFACYETELCDYPHPRSLKAVENLAAMMGNQCCMEYAEAFETVRRVHRGEA
jgi:LmbE family N-acetylglucosaminyl deacetylase